MRIPNEFRDYVLFELVLAYLTTMALKAGVEASTFAKIPIYLRQAYALYQLEKEKRMERIRMAVAEEARELKRQSNRVRDFKRKLRNEEDGFSGKRRKTKLQWRIGIANCMRDYLGEEPTFDDLAFQRMFAVSREVALKTIEVAAANRPDIFDTQPDIKGKKIPAFVKVLNVLKCVRFGVSFGAFQDYFQIGEETVRVAFHAYFDAITRDEELTKTFFSVRLESFLGIGLCF